MKKVYKSPQLVDYGRIDELTLGTSGAQPDLIVGPGGVLMTNPTNPTCTNNGAPYLACVPV